MRILLIEDHEGLVEFIGKGLRAAGFGIDAFATARDGASAAETIAYDAVILDLGLPDRDGLDLLRDLRRRGRRVPILILTARDDIDDRVRGLDAGADDYLVKPFAMKELSARLRALLRRPGAVLGNVLSVANVTLDTAQRQLMVDGRAAPVSRREFDMLELLMRSAGRVVGKQAIEDKIYGLGDEVMPNAIETLISRLRKRLASLGAAVSIHTMRGVGYLLKE
jgi:DNA-binding response OmpR family regulator